MTDKAPSYRTLPAKDRLPHALYTADQVRAFDRMLINDFGIPGAALMERAGQAAFRLMCERWPDAGDITVVCGIGNNGGDGFVVARLALKAGRTVRVLQLGDPARLHGDALLMAQNYEAAGGESVRYDGLPPKTDLIVDAVLGTGLERDVTGAWAEALSAINAHPAPKLSLDIPSGLNSDTGREMGIAVRAHATISFIGLKQGMFTGEGRDCCGEVFFDALDAPAKVYASQILSARRIDWNQQRRFLKPRRRTAHKGNFGHVLVVGGAPGFSGAARMAAEAAARCGAGLVSVATAPEHAALLNIGRPELMCHGVQSPADLTALLSRATVVVIGPGLGQSDWARKLLGRVLESELPLVLDADALNLIALEPESRGNWIMTPHPGEASRLLGTGTADTAQDRFLAVRNLQARFGGVAVLKGAGTLIEGPGNRPPAVCDGGNPGMASGGMGDILSGVIGAFIAQGFGPEQAAELGVTLHAAAGDVAARHGERGLLAGDLFDPIRKLLSSEAGL